MSSAGGAFIGHARTDGENRLVEADELLRGLQQRCGGALGETLAIPELLALVRKAARYGFKLSREVRAFDGDVVTTAWVEVTPLGDGAGCDIGVLSWHAEAAPPENEADTARVKVEIDRDLAELSARLGPYQNILSVDCEAPDLAQLCQRMREGVGRPWTEFVDLPALGHHQPVHWRLLDGARCVIDGSDRHWTATLVPLGQPEPGRAGFELYLTAETPLPTAHDTGESDDEAEHAPSLGRDIAKTLREPIARISANAETIRSRLAGPLAQEYADYAGDIAQATQHLAGLIDDLADLEVVESDGFSTAPDRIDLMDAARRAAGMLGGRAQECGISIILPPETSCQPAVGEFRRVMQVLLNLVGNALRYAPSGSTVTLSLARDGGFATLSVADEGPGLTPEQQVAAFEKFERLGRSGDGGSGLGLYISRRIARAMGGDLTVESVPGEGARFTLSVPAGD